MAKPPRQAGLFDPPPAPKPAPPARPPVEQAIIEFSQRHLGHQFRMTDLDNTARRAVSGLAFGAGRAALVVLQAAGVVEYEMITSGLYRITAVKA